MTLGAGLSGIYGTEHRGEITDEEEQAKASAITEEAEAGGSRRKQAEASAVGHCGFLSVITLA